MKEMLITVKNRCLATKIQKMYRSGKLRDMCGISIGISLVVITILLIIVLHAGFRITNDSVAVSQDDQNRTDGEVNNAMQKITNMLNTLTSFQNQLQLRDYIGKRSSDDSSSSEEIIINDRDRFEELYQAIDEVENITSKDNNDQEAYPTLGDLLGIKPNENSSIFERFHLKITGKEVYAEDSKEVDALLRELASREIESVEQKSGGTQIKLIIDYDNGMSALFKPMRFPRDQQTFPNHIYYADFERHTSSIASFHLDRALGFRRVFPTTGRTLNMTSEIYELADDELQKTFFTSPDPDFNKCFYGECRRYCDVYHPICGDKEMLEGSFEAFFPEYDEQTDLVYSKSPWRRSYSAHKKALWEMDNDYCERIKTKAPYNKGRLLLDLMDSAVFDFLSGNMDRHHYGYFEIFGENSCLVHIDNGRGFGRAFHDEMSNLAPLVQCCMIRSSTLKTLLNFHNGEKPLSQVMREAMENDPIAPVLWEPHLQALDRRVAIILSKVRQCTQMNSAEDVIYTRNEINIS